MGFTLPKLTHDLDCGPLGYPGLVVTLQLNLPYEPLAYPWDGIEDEAERQAEQERIIEAEPWQAPFMLWLGRIVTAITFPPEMSEDGKRLRVDIPDARSLHELMFTPGFDQQIIIWASNQYNANRDEWREAARKN